MKTDRDLSGIFNEAVQVNRLTCKDVVKICIRSENTVFKWLNGTLTPDGLAFVQLHAAILAAKLILPRDLSRTKSFFMNAAFSWARANQSGNKEVTILGEKSRSYADSPLFYFDGREMSRTAIAVEMGMNYNTVYHRTRHSPPGSDVTVAIKKKIQLGRPSKKVAKRPPPTQPVVVPSEP